MRLDKKTKRELLHILRNPEVTPIMRSRVIQELDNRWQQEKLAQYVIKSLGLKKMDILQYFLIGVEIDIKGTK